MFDERAHTIALADFSSSWCIGRTVMNKDQIKGRAEQAKGAVKEATGKVLDDKELQTEGKIDKVAGKAQAGVGDVKEKVADKLNKKPQP
jgi:uncharacterized protein YjbJ (UPF0337 family)